MTPGRDLDYAGLRAKHLDAVVPCTWLESNEPSYILYTSGTTGRPKGVPARRRRIRGRARGVDEAHLLRRRRGDDVHHLDIGWVVGHSYIIYGPLIAGMTTVLYEGVPIRPDPGIWWKIVQDHKVNVMFSAPTAIRVLKKHDPAFLRKYDLRLAQAPFPRGASRSTSPTPQVDRGSAAEAGHRSLLADRERLADPVLGSRRGEDTHQARQSEFSRLRLRAQAAARVGRRGSRPRTRKPWWRSRRPCRRDA